MIVVDTWLCGRWKGGREGVIRAGKSKAVGVRVSNGQGWRLHLTQGL